MVRVRPVALLSSEELFAAAEDIIDNRADLIDNGICLTTLHGGVSVEFCFGLPADSHAAYGNELHKIIRPEVVSELRRYSECRYRPNAMRERALAYLSDATLAQWL